MAEFEAIEAVAASAANAFTALTIYISVTFGFFATAYLVGSKLTRFQTLAAMGLYIVAAGLTALSMIAWLQAIFVILRSEISLLDTIPLLETDYWVPSLSVLLAMGILVSLYFMWDVRRPMAE